MNLKPFFQVQVRHLGRQKIEKPVQVVEHQVRRIFCQKFTHELLGVWPGCLSSPSVGSSYSSIKFVSLFELFSLQRLFFDIFLYRQKLNLLFLSLSPIFFWLSIINMILPIGFSTDLDRSPLVIVIKLEDGGVISRLLQEIQCLMILSFLSIIVLIRITDFNKHTGTRGREIEPPGTRFALMAHARGLF